MRGAGTVHKKEYCKLIRNMAESGANILLLLISKSVFLGHLSLGFPLGLLLLSAFLFTVSLLQFILKWAFFKGDRELENPVFVQKPLLYTYSGMLLVSVAYYMWVLVR